MLDLQDRMFLLALALEEIDWSLLHRQPIPDWQLRGHPAEFEKAYEYVQERYTFRRPEHIPLTERILAEKRCYQYDALAMTPTPSEWLSDDTLRRLRNMELQRDPFLTETFLGYISTYHDFCLISAGPDGDSDILGFTQHVSGEYHAEGDIEVMTPMDRIEALGRQTLRPSDSSADDPLVEIVIDANLIYDPTNGVLSNGDVVFHRRTGDNFLFSYPGNVVLTTENIRKKDIHLTE